LAGFFVSYGVLVLGLLHSWFGVPPADVAHTEAAFQIGWLVVFATLAVASVRLPALFTVLFVAFSVVLVLLLAATLGPSQGAGKAAGVIVLIIAAAAAYVFLAVASAVSGGREYPLGPPLKRG
jgi:succinate-acetate transporter protein